MMILTHETLEMLRKTNYVRKASKRNNYWVDFSKNKLENYAKHFGDNFNLIVFSEYDINHDYYIIPYGTIKNVLTSDNLTTGANSIKSRWIVTIPNHKFKVKRYLGIDIQQYYTTINAEQFLEISERDINAILLEEDFTNIEGNKMGRLVNIYERRPELRAKAIEHHGTSCICCGFDFEKKYGAHGKNYIEVHHLIPLYKLIKPTEINPETDMTVLCSNCHRMVHRNKDKPLSIEELKLLISNKK